MADQEAKKRLEDEIKKAYEFIAELRSIGGRVPKLEQALITLQKAVETGQEIGLAAKDAQQALQFYTDDLTRACELAPEDERVTCEVKVASKWQARAVHWTLSLDNNKSVMNNSIKRILCKQLPDVIGKRIQSCAGDLTEKK